MKKSSESLVPAFLLQSALLNPPEEVKELITRICNYACELQEDNPISLIGKPVELKDGSGVGVIVGVRVDHNKDIHIEGKWTSFGKVDYHWRRLGDKDIVVREMPLFGQEI